MNCSPDECRELHPSWALDMDRLGPWREAGEDAPGGWFRADSPSQAPLVLTAECATTMESARQLVRDGLLGPWGAVLCGRQTEGRGQLRRPWASLAGNLHASIVLPPPPVKGEWSEALPYLLPLVVGYIFSEILQDVGASLEIKWPNDILQDGRKVGGMLIEERDGVSILGLGLNVADCPDDAAMREDHSVPAGKLATEFSPATPLTLLELLVNRGKNMYAVMLDEIPPTRFTAMVESKLAWFGRTILVREGDSISYEAVLTGLSQKGGLVLRRGDIETVLYSGSIFPLRVPH